MKYTLRNKKTLIVLLVVVALALAVAYVAGWGSTDSAIRIGYAGNEGRSSWSGSYFLLDGSMQRTLYPQGDVLHITVETTSGSLALKISDQSGQVIFDQEHMETGTFDVPASGPVEVRLDAQRHKGSFSLDS